MGCIHKSSVFRKINLNTLFFNACIVFINYKELFEYIK